MVFYDSDFLKAGGRKVAAEGGEEAGAAEKPGESGGPTRAAGTAPEREEAASLQDDVYGGGKMQHCGVMDENSRNDTPRFPHGYGGIWAGDGNLTPNSEIARESRNTTEREAPVADIWGTLEECGPGGTIEEGGSQRWGQQTRLVSRPDPPRFGSRESDAQSSEKEGGQSSNGCGRSSMHSGNGNGSGGASGNRDDRGGGCDSEKNVPACMRGGGDTDGFCSEEPDHDGGCCEASSCGDGQRGAGDATSGGPLFVPKGYHAEKRSRGSVSDTERRRLQLAATREAFFAGHVLDPLPGSQAGERPQADSTAKKSLAREPSLEDDRVVRWCQLVTGRLSDVGSRNGGVGLTGGGDSESLAAPAFDPVRRIGDGGASDRGEGKAAAVAAASRTISSSSTTLSATDPSVSRSFRDTTRAAVTPAAAATAAATVSVSPTTIAQAVCETYPIAVATASAAVAQAAAAAAAVTAVAGPVSPTTPGADQESFFSGHVLQSNAPWALGMVGKEGFVDPGVPLTRPQVRETDFAEPLPVLGASSVQPKNNGDHSDGVGETGNGDRRGSVFCASEAPVSPGGRFAEEACAATAGQAVGEESSDGNLKCLVQRESMVRFFTPVYLSPPASSLPSPPRTGPSPFTRSTESTSGTGGQPRPPLAGPENPPQDALSSQALTRSTPKESGSNVVGAEVAAATGARVRPRSDGGSASSTRTISSRRDGSECDKTPGEGGTGGEGDEVDGRRR